MNKICIRCNGTGKYRGQGFMETSCELCGKDYSADAPVDCNKVPLEKVDRRSKSYKEAIGKLMELNPEMTKEDAVKLFDETYEKV